MDSRAIREKFGQDYAANERTFVMGIDQRLTAEIAGRFRNRRVLETCTGGGFTTIALARQALRVITIEIDPICQVQAKQNLATAGVADRVEFVLADIMYEKTWDGLSRIDAALLDPDWAITGPNHVHRFVHSTTRPPADALLERTLRATSNVALILPPTLDTRELNGLPVHERQKLYIGQNHELYCLYFGNLSVQPCETELRV